MNLLTDTLTWVLRFTAFYLLIIAALNFLPAGQTLPVEFTNGIKLAFAYIRGLNFLIPVDTIFTIIIASVSYIGIVYVFEYVLWAVHMYRGLRS